MKNKALLLVTVLLAGGLFLASCDGADVSSGGDKTTETPDSSTKVEEKWDVKYMDGDKVLHTVEVEDGETAPNWDPTETVTDKTFHGWYIEPVLAHEWDFDTPITADTNIYGKFTTFTEDTRTWVIAGSGSSSILKASNWGTVVNDNHKMTKVEDDSANIYTYTVDLFVGDQFQFMEPVYGEDGSIAWGAQRGAGYFETMTDDAGVAHFSGGGGLGGQSQKSNVTAEVSGNYTFTLTTYPDLDQYFDDETSNPNQNYSAYDSITWKRNGDTTEVQAQYEKDFYIKGAKITGWKDMLTSRNLMVPNDDRTIYTLSIYLEEGDEIMFASRFRDTATNEYTTGNEYIRGNMVTVGKDLVTGESNMKPLASGLYTFTWKYEEQALEITVDKDATAPWLAYDYYINGNFNDDAAWANKLGKADYKFTKQDDNKTYVLEKDITLKADEQLGIQVTPLGNVDFPNADGTAYTEFWGFDRVVLASGQDDFKGANGNSGNIVCVNPGTYHVSFDAYSQIITIAPVA